MAPHHAVTSLLSVTLLTLARGQAIQTLGRDACNKSPLLAAGRPEVGNSSAHGDGGTGSSSGGSSSGSAYIRFPQAAASSGRDPVPLKRKALALAAAGRPTACLATCHKYGTCNEELGRCDCPKDRAGPDCSQRLGPDALWARCNATYHPSVRECLNRDLACLNDCNRRGRCMAGFCHCEAGFYGADCSLSIGPDGKPQLLAGRGYAPRQKRPWVYVYELPPEITTWLDYTLLDRPLHLLFYQRLLSSGARVADAAQADWFYVPVRVREDLDTHLFATAMEYVRQAWPHYNRTQGRRHLVFHTGDLGSDELDPDARGLAANLTWLTHWGLTRDKEYSGWHAAHRPQQDVVVPVYLSVGRLRIFGLERSPLHPLQPDTPRRNVTLFFAGRICGDRQPPRVGSWPNCGPFNKGYSGGVRQLVHYHHWNRTGFHIVTGEPRYSDYLRTSRYCLAPLGGGHGQRQILVSFMGCVPVIISDHVLEPLEPALDWGKLGVRVAEADIPRLHEVLGAIGAEEYARKQAALRCAAQHFLYSSITGGYLGEDGRFDAFESTLEVLRVMAAHPGAPPDKYRKLDADFDAFMDCRDPKGFRAAVPQALMGDGAAVQGGSGAAAEAAKGAGRGRGAAAAAAAASNPLCSYARAPAVEGAAGAGRKVCERFLRGRTSALLVPGGVICGDTAEDLAACPRVWL